MPRLVAVLALVMLAVTGCYHYEFQGAMSAEVPTAGKEELAPFAYDKTAEVPTRFFGKTEKTKDYITREIKWRVRDFDETKEKHAKGYFYEPLDKTKTYPALVILPPTGGPYKLVKEFAKYYAKRGFVVIGMRRREFFFRPDKPMSYTQKQIQQAVIDARRAIDYMDELPYVDKDRVAVMGISLGGIVGALTMASDERVKAAGFIVSAAHLPDILASSGFRRVRNLRSGLAEQADIPRAQLVEYFRPQIKEVDPATYADRLDPSRIVMVNAAMDDIVVKDVVLKTHETYGKPELYFVFGGHYTTIGMSGGANEKVYQHFRKVLALR
ncbi:dienelactone hydrolase family protein [bacterium]|nr:dienelactone hydrolase family protein [bacterium]